MIHEHHFRAMGCEIATFIDSPDPQAGKALQQAPVWFEEWEESLSRFRPESELSRLNRAKGQPVQVSETLWQVLQLALTAERQSGGLVTPAVLDALVAAGYDRSFDLLPDAPLQPSNHRPIPAPTVDSIECDPQRRTIRLPLGLHLDFGGVAKGWAAEQAVQRLKIYGPALVDAGGDIAISGPLENSGSLEISGALNYSGPQADGLPWLIGLADPLHPDEDLEMLELGRGGVATSGRDYRHWQQGDRQQHHLIDPRTGLPAETDLLSVTVIAPTLNEAEMAAKTVLISGSQTGLDWLEARPKYAGLLVLENGNYLISERMQSFLWRTHECQNQ